MDTKLFNELIEIGIDKTTAHEVAASLSPEHVANKEDILRLERLILDNRLSSKKDILRLEHTVSRVQREMKEEMAALRMDLNKETTEWKQSLAALQSKTSEQFTMHNRQFTITFLGLILTACVLFTMNLYFH